MDVVYNHVYDADSFAFEKIVPGYFYRLDEQNNELTELSVVTMLQVRESWSVASSSIRSTMGESLWL